MNEVYNAFASLVELARVHSRIIEFNNRLYSLFRIRNSEGRFYAGSGKWTEDQYGPKSKCGKVYTQIEHVVAAIRRLPKGTNYTVVELVCTEVALRRDHMDRLVRALKPVADSGGSTGKGVHECPKRRVGYQRGR